MMQLQLMCCALSNFLSSQFARGWIEDKMEEILGRQGGREFKSIFELAKYIE
jgi:hypothetical protein